MDRSRKTIVGILGLVVLGMAFAFGAGFIERAAPSISAAPGTTDATGTAQQQQQQQQQASQSDVETYVNALVTNFASRLGVDQARVNTEFTAAANDTIAQAVRDGKLSESQAADARKMVEGGLSSFMLKTGLKADGGRDSKDDPIMDAAQTAAFNAAATTIGVSLNELMQGMKAGGKSITDLATEHHVDPQKVRDAMLAAARNSLNSQVTGGKLTQAEADQRYNDMTHMVDKVMSAKHVERSYRNIDDQVQIAAWEAGAKSLGLDGGQMKQALGSGKTLADLAREHNIDPQKLRETMLAAGKAKLDSLVSNSGLTQAAADDQYQGLTEWVDTLFNGAPKTQ